MARDNIEQIGLRLPTQINMKLDSKANEVGISKNALILVLIDIGYKALEAKIISNPED